MKETGKNVNDVMDELESYLNAESRDRGPLTVLEAGCGSATHISLGKVEKVVGIDISKERLLRNPQIQEGIEGDLETYPLPERAFDMVVCWNVMEHLPNPWQAMENFFRSLKDGGLIVLAFPNLCSLKGVITKFTPYRAHVWFYRYVFGDTRKEDFEQFPTYLRPFIVPRRLAAFAESRGFSVGYMKLYEGPVERHWRERSGVMDWAFGLLGFLSRLFTLNRIDLNHTDCVLVLKKTG
jgi:SAM-dependent methyltransferase